MSRLGLALTGHCSIYSADYVRRRHRLLKAIGIFNLFLQFSQFHSIKAVYVGVFLIGFGPSFAFHVALCSGAVYFICFSQIKHIS